MRRSVVSLELGLAGIATLLPIVLIVTTPTFSEPMFVSYPTWAPLIPALGILGYVLGWVWIWRILRIEV